MILCCCHSISLLSCISTIVQHGESCGTRDARPHAYLKVLLQNTSSRLAMLTAMLHQHPSAAAATGMLQLKPLVLSTLCIGAAKGSACSLKLDEGCLLTV